MTIQVINKFEVINIQINHHGTFSLRPPCLNLPVYTKPIIQARQSIMIGSHFHIFLILLQLACRMRKSPTQIANFIIAAFRHGNIKITGCNFMRRFRKTGQLFGHARAHDKAEYSRKQTKQQEYFTELNNFEHRFCINFMHRCCYQQGHLIAQTDYCHIVFFPIPSITHEFLAMGIRHQKISFTGNQLSSTSGFYSIRMFRRIMRPSG